MADRHAAPAFAVKKSLMRSGSPDIVFDKTGHIGVQ